MKKLWLVAVISLTLSTSSQAGWQDSDWSEPAIGCLAGGIGMFAVVKSDSTMKAVQNFAIGCAVVGTAGYAMNKYYKAKIGRSYGDKINTLEENLYIMQMQKSRNTANGIIEHPLLQNELIEGHMNSSGEWVHPTYKTRLRGPADSLTIGD